ncbi:MAG: HlyD family secretion protein, partial [Sphaerospermopsis kisseleviana]
DQAQQNINTLKNAYQFHKEEKSSQLNQAEETLTNSQTTNQLAESSLLSSQREVKRYSQLRKQRVIPETNLVEKQNIVKEKQKLYAQSQSDIRLAKLRLAEYKSSYERNLRQANADIEQAKLRLGEQQRSYRTLTLSGQSAVLKIAEQQK